MKIATVFFSACLTIASSNLTAAQQAEQVLQSGLQLSSRSATAVAWTEGDCTRSGNLRWKGLNLNDGHVEGADILNEIQGYAKEAGVTGGLGGQLLVVTSADDYGAKDPPIPGTLRAAVEHASKNKVPAWIVFDPRLGPQTRINLKDILRLPDNITLDGSCADVTLQAPSKILLVFIADKRNVIIERLAFRKTDYWPGMPDAETGSCIRLNGFFDAIAIIHNDLEQCGDGVIDITISPGKPVPPVARATVAFNRISNHDKVMLFGTFTCGPTGRDDEPCTEQEAARNRVSAPALYLTLEGNLFLRTAQRHPRVFGRVMAHIVNNVVGFQQAVHPDGQRSAVYGIFVSNGARALVEQNVFLALTSEKGSPGRAVWTTTTPGALKMPWDVEGFIRIDGNRTDGAEIVAQSEPQVVTDPPYRSTEVIASIRSLPLQRAIACVASRAGRGGGPQWDSAICR